MRLFPGTFFRLSAFLLLQTLAPFAGAQVLNTVAGNCSAGYTIAAQPATQASLDLPDDLAFDSQGNYYIADAGSNTIRKVTVATGILTTFAGVLNSGGNLSSGNGGPAAACTLDYPSGIVFDSANNLYIADFYAAQVRKIDASTGYINAFAGTGTPNDTGDGGPATLAQLWNPTMVRFDPTGRYLVISDLGSSTVREVDTTTGLIKTVAGDFALGPGYSGDNGPATLAQLNQPDGLAFDAAGDLFIADNLNGAVRRVDVSTGNISTVAGTGVTGYSGDSGPATLAQLGNDLGSLAFTCDGNLLIADGSNKRVRMVNKTTGTITTVIGTGNLATSCPVNGTGVLSTGISLPQAVVFNAASLYLVDYGNSGLVLQVPGGLCPATATPTLSPTPTATLSPTATPTPTVSATPTLSPTPTLTSTVSPTPTPTVSATPTPPLPPADCNTVQTYSYPNPARGGTMNVLYVLCEAGPVKITVYNTAADWVASYSTVGSVGPNVYVADISSFSYGVYYYFVNFDGPSGNRRSKPTKFAVVR